MKAGHGSNQQQIPLWDHATSNVKVEKCSIVALASNRILMILHVVLRAYSGRLFCTVPGKRRVASKEVNVPPRQQHTGHTSATDGRICNTSKCVLTSRKGFLPIARGDEWASTFDRPLH